MRAAVLGLRLIGDDVELQAAIRRELERARTPALKAGGGNARRSRHVAEDMVGQRRKLLRLYYADKIGADLFAEEEARLSVAIREAQREADEAQGELARARTMSHSTSMLSLACWQASTSTRRGMPRRRSSDVSSSTSSSRKFRCYRITST